MKRVTKWGAILLMLLLWGCISEKDTIDSLTKVDITSSEQGIVPLPDDISSKMRDVFSKYTKVTAPNGRPIHIFAQSGVSNAKVVRARQILAMYLTDVKGSKYGSFKSLIANSMADRNAALYFFNTEDDKEQHMSSLTFAPFNGQDLYASEAFVEGSPEYIQNSPRDASYEEILHLTQDYGITPMLPQYQKEIYDRAHDAVSSNIYMPPSELPKADYDQEYLASVWDVYLDAWAYQDPPAQYGEYLYNTREMLKEKDPIGYGLVEAFLPAVLTYNAHIYELFEGTFHLDYREDFSYTHKSKHLRDATLTGTLNSGLQGNQYDNNLTGNIADNTFIGGKGDDYIDGNDGTDTVVYEGMYSEYEITITGTKTVIKDKVSDRDHTDTVIHIEKLQFKDRTISI
ncbi:hypothetical protein K5X82_10105 [Halosquirtibacter xylanolyticus]|uniref:calcium-binding protein n=1 Tax=Halosquirtibacter xylanolyticus TaxID=3374599 RepID=UPI003748E8F7|nr:hypothetical protein K5X82_10105 [Prolixibacteraceae bacterium]